MQSFLLNIMFSYPFLGQVKLEGLEKAAETSPLNAALVGFIVILLTALVFLFKEYSTSRVELKELNKEHAKKLDDNKKEYIEKFEKVQNEYLRREDDRNKQWSESEKETLGVLNGVTSILEMSEKIGQNDKHEILEKLKILEERIINAINSK